MHQIRPWQCLLSVLLLLQLVLPPVGASAASHRAVRIKSVTPTLAVSPQVMAAVSAMPAAPSARQGPFLALSWKSAEAHAGAPTDLTIQATASDHHTKLHTSGTVRLLLPDVRAEVAGANGMPTSGGSAFMLPLSDGAATVTITFETPRLVSALATLVGSAPRIAGQSTSLRVHDTRFAIKGPVAVGGDQAASPTTAPSGKHAGQPVKLKDRRERFTIVAQDENGAAVDGYDGVIVVTTSDKAATIGRPGQAQAQQAQAKQRFLPDMHG